MSVSQTRKKQFTNLKRLALFSLILFVSITMSIITASPILESQAKAAQTSKAITKWTCPMHPHYIADDAGSCPICGMDLVKINAEAKQDETSNENEKPIITIAPETIQNMGVRLAKVETSEFGKNIRSFGIVEENERLQSEISARVEGWIEKLNITAVGDEVKSGDILFEMFSPELVVSQRDFLIALKQSKSAQNNIKKRLLSFGVQQQALNLITKEKEVRQNLPFFATQKGTISELNVTPGTYVQKGMTIAKIQDYSEVWVIVNVSEKDMGFMSKGTKTTIHFPNLPGKTIKSTVDYIYPNVDERTRTGRVRLVINNKEGKLRPGTYADVVFETEISERLSIPSEAILKNQDGNFVVVALGSGKFQSKRIELGLVSGGRAEIKSGLKENEKIVISSQFMIDSESALRESFKKLEKLQQPLDQLNLKKVELAKFDHIIDAALYIHESLTNNSKMVGQYLDAAISIKSIMWAEHKETKLANILEGTHDALKNAQAAKTKSELKNALAQLTTALEPWILEGAPDHYKTKNVMFFRTKDTDKKWLQLSKAPKNPYSNEQAELINWPKKKITKPQTTSTKEKENQDTPRGSHHMRGSH